MKSLLFAFIALFAVTTANASEKVISEKELPLKTREFIKTHFADDKISIATVESDIFDKDYKVILTSGTKLEFDSKGNWTEIECKGENSVPEAIIPKKISEYLKSNHKSNTVVKIERSKKRIEVELNNDIELTFNLNGELVEFDS